MRVRKFEAPSFQQAMVKVKAELGENAVLLHTRTYPGRFFGLFGKSRVEITAAVEDQQPLFNASRVEPSQTNGKLNAQRPAVQPEPSSPPENPNARQMQSAAHEFLSKIEKIRQTHTSLDVTVGSSVEVERSVSAPSPSTACAPSIKVESPRLEALEVRIDRLANSMERLLSISGPLGRFGLLAEAPVEWHACMKRLMESSLSEANLRRMALKLMSIPHPGPEFEPKIVRELLAGLVSSVPPIAKPEYGQRIITLVGPTGVGKTTTLAKLASGLVVNSRVPTRVGLITVDTYRLAAEDQLRKYAEILRLDLQVVYGPEEMRDAIKRCHNADVIFIDTAGRSPRDETQMAELRSFLEPIPECEKCLVLSSTMNDRYIEEAVERFRPLSINSLIITKLDETRNYAAPLNIYQQTKIPISYLTTGQNVPEDIEPLDPSRIAGEIINAFSAETDEEAESFPASRKTEV